MTDRLYTDDFPLREIEDVTDSSPSQPSFFGAGSTSRPVSEKMTIKNELRPDQQIDVLLVSQDTEFLQKLRDVFSEKNFFALRALSGRVSDIEDKLEAVQLPVVAIMDLNAGNARDLEALERLKKGRFRAVPVIVLSSYLDQDIVRSLVQIKVEDWLPKDSNLLEVHKSCERAARANAPQKQEQEAVCYSFFPATGGCGNTTLAIQAAFLIGRRTKQLNATCLVDLNFQDGPISEYLDLTPAFQLNDLANAPGRLDNQLLDVMISRHASGLSVLSAPRVPARHIEISEGLIASVLGLLSKSYSHIVLDLPKTWYPWTDNVIWGANKVFIVTSFTVPGLRQARFVSDAIVAKARPETDVSVIVNKYHKPVLGTGLLQQKDAERILVSRMGGFVPDVGSMVDESINQGIALADAKPGNKLEKKLAEIIFKA